MGANTNIEWCDHSWSPWRGCTKVSAGCANCYAETLSKRNPAVLGQWGKGKPRVKAKNWSDPRKWQQANEKTIMSPLDKPPTVFPSLCDWLDDEVPIEWLAEFLQLIHDTPNLTWLLLTKRPENWRGRMESVRDHALIADNYDLHGFVHRWLARSGMWPPANVWLGTSVEDQANADRRIPALLQIPARGRFLSLEPLLGPVDLTSVEPFCSRGGSDQYGLDWLIIGGESGPGARPCNVEWIRSLVRQGKEAGVPTFVKQLGARPQITPQGYDPVDGTLPKPHPLFSVNHPKGGDPAEWPKDIQVREFPTWGGAS